MIGRNKSLINFGYLSDLVQYFYFKLNSVGKEKEKSVIIQAVKELTDDFNLLTEHNIIYLEKEYSYRQLAAIMCTFNYFNTKGKDKSKMVEIIDEVIKRTEELDNKKFYSKTPKKSMMNDIEYIIREVE